MDIIPVGTTVKVQLGPNIEEGVIADGRFGDVRVKMADGNSVKVDRSKLIMEAVPEPPSPPDVTAAFAVPDLARTLTDEEASAYVITDEWDGQIEQGEPFEEAAAPYKLANPDRHFRYIGDVMTKRRGKRGYVPVIDKASGKPVVVSGMTLSSIPMHIHEERVRRVDAKTDGQAAQRQEPIREQLADAGKAMGLGTAALDAFDTARTLGGAGGTGTSGSDIRNSDMYKAIRNAK